MCTLREVLLCAYVCAGVRENRCVCVCTLREVLCVRMYV